MGTTKSVTLWTERAASTARAPRRLAEAFDGHVLLGFELESGERELVVP